MGTCTMCEGRPATTTYGFSVCQECYDWLVLLDGDLKAMQAADPELARRAARVEETAKQILGEPFCRGTSTTGEVEKP